MRRLGVNHKRTVSVSVKMSQTDIEEFEREAKLRWSGAILTRSTMILSFARRGLEAFKAERKNKH